MRVAVTRSGGLAGMVRRAELDSADHPAVARLIDQLDLGSATAGPYDRGRHGEPPGAAGDEPAGRRATPPRKTPARPAGGGPKKPSGADRFVYDIQIGDRAMRVGEADLGGPLRRLVEHVMTHGR